MRHPDDDRMQALDTDGDVADPAGEVGPRSPANGSGEARPDVRYEGAGLFGGALLLILIAVVVVAAVAQNTGEVTFELLWLDITTPLVVLLLVAALIAVLVDEIVGLLWRRRRRSQREL